MSPVLTMVVGAVLGFLSGLFGVGGSSIATPILRLLDVPRLVALATPLPITLPTALIGGFTYWRRGMVRWRVVGWTVGGGIPAVILGSWYTTLVPGRLLMLLTGVFVVAVGYRLLRDLPALPGAATRTEPSVTRMIAVGACVGFFSGLLGNGGGFLLVPAYLLLYRMEAHETAATSLVSVGLLALPGTFVHARLGHIDFDLAFWLGVGVIPFTYLGARASLALRDLQVRRLFGVFLLVFGIFFLLRTLYRLELYGLTS